MYWLYTLPFFVLTGFLGTLGGLLAVVIFLLGLLRFLFLVVLLITGDMERFKSEWKEGYLVVIEKLKWVWMKIENLFK